MRCFIYNAFTDLHLTFDGRPFSFLEGKVTELNDITCTAPDLRRRNHESDPRPDAMLDRTYNAREFAEMLFTRHGQNLIGAGVISLTDEPPSDKQKTFAVAAGRIFKIKMCEEALAERRSALARGGKPELDPLILDWMKAYEVRDELFNPKPAGDVLADLSAVLQQAMAQNAAAQAMNSQQSRK